MLVEGMEYGHESYADTKMIFEPEILYYFISRLDSYDRYFFIFAFVFEKKVRRGISIHDLKRLENSLPYKSRIYEKSFTRLEAIDFLTRHKSKRTKEFTLSPNGLNAVIELREENIDKFESEVKSIQSIIANSNLY